MGSGERVKPQLSQALTRDVRLDSNSRPVVQISSHLPSRYAPSSLVQIRCLQYAFQDFNTITLVQMYFKTRSLNKNKKTQIFLYKL